MKLDSKYSVWGALGKNDHPGKWGREETRAPQVAKMVSSQRVWGLRLLGPASA